MTGQVEGTLAAPSPARLRGSVSATLAGLGAIALWALLAALTAGAGAVPPFQMTALTFGIAFGAWCLRGPRAWAHLRQRPAVWLLGVGGLFAYHALYFAALQRVPPAEASLICYLWPLLIVLGGAIFGEGLRWYHLGGALAGLAGTALLMGDVDFAAASLLGYGLALAAAFTWAAYSLLSRQLPSVSTDAVGGFCGGVAVLALACHLAFEQTAWPTGWTAWAAVLGLGLGPVGLAFFLWDVGMKRGDAAVLGALSYGAPLFSTLILLALGWAAMQPGLIGACLLIAGGGALAARDLILPRR
ncbi:aromatic amino acid exporter YddG [Zavarzinia sp. CC-PAN008]|uniref:aromatic amino acid exporter YddG n=1 Tax=Zavarzinia sp. CC-PAN008 TaxID=3243332 RepID=UPI003F74635F